MSQNTSDWKSFRFRLEFDPSALKDELVRIEAYRLSLNQIILPQEWHADLQHLFIVRSVHGTTAIEGNPLTEDEVSQQLEATRTRRRDQVHRQTGNALTAFKWVEKEFASPGRRVSFTDILAIHELLTTGSDQHDNHPGRIRESGHNVTVGSPELGGIHRPPPGGPDLVKLVREFVKFINSSLFLEQNTVVQSLVAHFYLVTLHPFGDGNGRMTRGIEAAILFGGGYNTYGFYSLSNFFYRNRDDYFRLLQQTRTKYRFDLTRFVLFGMRGFREELDRINAYVRNRTHRLHYRELIRRCRDRRVGKRRRLLNEREADLLHQILDHTKPADPFSSEPAREVTWEDLCRIARPSYESRTPRTMARELIRLEQVGFLHIEGSESVETWRFAIDFEAIARY
jgi:Fic family protein